MIMMRQARHLVTCGAIVLLAAAAWAQWTPEILSQYDIHNNPEAIDFSRAGYQAPAAGQPHPWGEREVRLDDPVGDSTARIQQAIDDMGDAGGGTVILGEGTWELNLTGLTMTKDNVRVQGQGPSRTFLHVNGTMTARTHAFHLGKTNKNTQWGSHAYPESWVRQGNNNVVEMLTQDGETNSAHIHVSSPTFGVGDIVIVTADATADFIADHGMTGVWTTQMDHPAYCREIVAVEPDGYVLDMPLRYPVQMRDNARVFRATQLVHNLSIAGFTLLYDRHPAEDFDAGVGANETAQCTAIRVTNVYNALIEDIEIPLLPSRGVELAYTRFATVRRVSTYESQNQNGFWNGYQFFVWGCDNLFQDCRAGGGRRAFCIMMAMAHGNVISNCIGYTSRAYSDFHMHLSHVNLVDSFLGVGDAWGAYYRPWGGPITHGMTSTENVFWNITSDEPDIVWSAQHGLGYVIGTRGGGRVKLDPSEGVAALPIDHVEGENMADTMAPLSLYRYQLTGSMAQSASRGWTLYE